MHNGEVATMTFDTYSKARQHLKDVLDAAASGRPVVVRRDNIATAVVDADRLRRLLGQGYPRPEVVSEAGGWSVFIPGVPVAADGATFEEALGEMADALREYAEEWEGGLRHAPHHRDNWPLVQLVGLSSDQQLVDWIAGA